MQDSVHFWANGVSSLVGCAGARRDDCGRGDTNSGELVTPYHYPPIRAPSCFLRASFVLGYFVLRHSYRGATFLRERQMHCQQQKTLTASGASAAANPRSPLPRHRTAFWCAGARRDDCGRGDTNSGELVTPYHYHLFAPSCFLRAWVCRASSFVPGSETVRFFSALLGSSVCRDTPLRITRSVPAVLD